MKRLLTLLALCCCSAAAAAETPLGGRWSFCTDPLNAGLREAWYAPGHDRSGWDETEVPGCWNTRLEYADYTGAAWYATTFVLPQKPAEYDILLDFEAVYADADVWLNGEHLGSHDFGFTSFGFDITGRIAPGASSSVRKTVSNWALHGTGAASAVRSPCAQCPVSVLKACSSAPNPTSKKAAPKSA